MGARALMLTLALLTPSTTAAAATPKPGTTCPRVGVVKNASGKQYTCVKRGKQLVWNNGILLPKPTPKPTPSPTPQLTRFELLSREDSIQGRALTQFLRFEAGTPATTQPFDFVFSPNSDPKIQEFIKSTMTISLNYFAKVFTDSRKFPVVYANEDDFEWFMNYMESNRIAPSHMRQEYAARIKQEGKNVNIGGSDVWDGDKNQINIIRGKNRSAPGEADYSFIAHEFTHAVQNFVAGGQSNIPCWTAEGAAQFFGNAISGRRFAGNYERMKYYTFQMVSEAPQQLNPWGFSDAQWIDAFTRLEKRGDLCSYDARISYAPGLTMTELMVADSGVATLVEWWSTGKTAEGWRAEFERLYGMPLDKWYVDVALPAVKQAHAENPPGQRR